MLPSKSVRVVVARFADAKMVAPGSREVAPGRLDRHDIRDLSRALLSLNPEVRLHGAGNS